MRRYGLLIGALAFSLVALAIPSDRRPLQLQLTDGRTVTAFCIGDEHYTWFQTTDGFVVEPAEDGLFRLTSRRGDEEALRAQAVKQHEQKANRAPRRIGSQTTAPLPAIGSPKVPVVLINFSDTQFTVGDTDDAVRHYYDLFCNGTGDGVRYQTNYFWGSIHDYFSDQSDGQFLPQFDIIGPVNLSHETAYYGKNSGASKDSRYSEMVKEAITLAISHYQVDWSKYDNRGKGAVDMVFLIFAGCGENTNQKATDLIWPKEKVESMNVNLDNGTTLKFSTSACCSELANNSSGLTPDGIGVMCHELSHALGLPDMYDTNYKAFGMDIWSLMDYGCYSTNGGRRPVGYTAYERDFMGWRDMLTLEAPTWVALDPICADGIGYRIVNDANTNEYYILENRQAVSWDAPLCRIAGHGMMVTHVDYNSAAWNSNQVNSIADHQRITILAANNKYIGTTASKEPTEWVDTWNGQLYPYRYTETLDDGTTRELCLDSLTAYSSPAATAFTGGLMHKDIHAIREHADSTITFYFGPADINAGPLMPAPPVIITEDNADEFRETTTVTIESHEPGTTVFYTIDGTEPTSRSLPYSGPIVLDQTTTVRAAAFVGTTLHSDIVQATVTRYYDAINDLKDENGKSINNKWYDLSGRQVMSPDRLRKGIYIHRGLKRHLPQ